MNPEREVNNSGEIHLDAWEIEETLWRRRMYELGDSEIWDFGTNHVDC